MKGKCQDCCREWPGCGAIHGTIIISYGVVTGCFGHFQPRRDTVPEYPCPSCSKVCSARDPLRTAPCAGQKLKEGKVTVATEPVRGCQTCGTKWSGAEPPCGNCDEINDWVHWTPIVADADDDGSPEDYTPPPFKEKVVRKGKIVWGAPADDRCQSCYFADACDVCPNLSCKDGSHYRDIKAGPAVEDERVKKGWEYNGSSYAKNIISGLLTIIEKIKNNHRIEMLPLRQSRDQMRKERDDARAILKIIADEFCVGDYTLLPQIVREIFTERDDALAKVERQSSELSRINTQLFDMKGEVHRAQSDRIGAISERNKARARVKELEVEKLQLMKERNDNHAQDSLEIVNLNARVKELEGELGRGKRVKGWIGKAAADEMKAGDWKYPKWASTFINTRPEMGAGDVQVPVTLYIEEESK